MKSQQYLSLYFLLSLLITLCFAQSPTASGVYLSFSDVALSNAASIVSINNLTMNTLLNKIFYEKQEVINDC